MRPNKKVYFAFAVVILAIVFLVAYGFNDKTMVYYSTVKELKARGANAVGQGFRVSGKVIPGSLQKAPDRVRASFDITEEGERLHVVYDGILPDTFKENMDVLVEGKYQANGEFKATNVFTKCASKYEPTDAQETGGMETGTN
ncbi:MAG: cytochrome c maturation protein CcmE [Calditrichaeota bacterium]|nr:MAG: cytochrome c maturation protein CcmE [Calditrichota bacterium]